MLSLYNIACMHVFRVDNKMLCPSLGKLIFSHSQLVLVVYSSYCRAEVLGSFPHPFGVSVVILIQFMNIPALIMK